ncbi:hypothetical protein [Thermoflexus hugenholtzii]
MEVWAWRWEGDEEGLRRLIREVLRDEVGWWGMDLAALRVEKGIPQAFLDRGAAFGSEGEVRWARRGERFLALILLDAGAGKGMPEGAEPLSDSPWPARETRVLLQPLTDRRVHPPFDCYPHGHPEGALRVREVQHPSGWILLSLRGFVS